MFLLEMLSDEQKDDEIVVKTEAWSDILTQDNLVVPPNMEIDKETRHWKWI